MSAKFTLLKIVLFGITITSGEVSKNRRGQRKNDEADKTLWKKEYEDELNEAMLSGKRENYTRSAGAQSGSLDNDAVLEKLMESITSSERYLKKVEAIEFRLNRLDIEVHEKTNAMMKLLNNILKSIRSESCSQKMEASIHGLVADVNSIKYAVEKTPRSSLTIQGITNDFLFRLLNMSVILCFHLKILIGYIQTRLFVSCFCSEQSAREHNIVEKKSDFFK